MDALSRRFLLRQKTRDAHERVDALVGGFTTVEDYRHYLSGLLGFRAPVEQAVADAPWPDDLEGWEPGRIAPLIAQDCADLDCLPVDTASSEPAADRSALFGTLYVLEGASLGAQLLVRRAAALGFTGAYGARHLAGQIAAPERWRRFLSHFETAEAIDLEAAAAAANRTFAAAEKAFGTAR